MTINVIVALLTTIGIAVALSLAIFVAGSLEKRGKTPAVRIAIPADRPDQPADNRELVLR
jgi:hypothetical protein